MFIEDVDVGCHWCELSNLEQKTSTDSLAWVPHYVLHTKYNLYILKKNGKNKNKNGQF